ncbi:MAG: toprim domain-containing protein [Planctomycetes bacterium]|nr:toprim domain-containing protein [Planctomycetota bacterium]
MRVKSDRPVRNGGWLHRTATAMPPPRPPCRVYVPAHPEPEQDWRALLERWTGRTAPADFARLAHLLGVSAASLRRLGAALSDRPGTWAFPMCDAKRRVIGIRLRAEDGRKWAVAGSHNGLFWPDGLAGIGPLLVCEGPTDTAALLDLGYDAIGRPSCTGVVDLVIQVVRAQRRRDVVIVADADGPGIEGANRLAEALTAANRRPKVIRPLKGKDARAWVQAGATPAVVDCAIANAQHWRG